MNLWKIRLVDVHHIGFCTDTVFVSRNFRILLNERLISGNIKETVILCLVLIKFHFSALGESFPTQW